MQAPLPLPSRSGLETALDSDFRVLPEGGEQATLAFRLVELKPRTAPAGHEQFSLLFVGPGAPFMPQGTRRFAHDALGTFDLFIVPVGRTAAGIEYEACISRETGA